MDGLKNVDLGLLLLRLAMGGFMIWGHGWGKLTKLLTERPIEFGDPIGLGPDITLGLAVFAEVVCAALVMLGLFTRWALLPLMAVMFVAFFFVHFSDAFGRQEKALLYFFSFLCLFFSGPGKFSLDNLLRKNPHLIQ